MKSYFCKTAHLIKIALGFLLIAFALVACGESPSKQNTAEKPPTAVVPAPTASAPEPQPVSRVTEATKQTYQWYCAQCHGIKGKGDGINARLLPVLPRDHTKASYLESRSDDQLFLAIKSGGLSVGRAPCMPAWGHTLDDDTIHSLVRYIRELCECEGA